VSGRGKVEMNISDTTTSSQLLIALHNAGVKYIFANLGSDHTGIIEAMAKLSEENKGFPEVIICPHEYVALCAAQGYTQTTGEVQAVFIHLDVGTSNLGGAVHNATRSRTPVFIFAGATPYTMEGELPGSRNTYVNSLQDAHDQAGIVRPYVKWSYELRTGKNVQQVVYRALQIADSSPKGPVYLMAAREVLEEQVDTLDIPFNGWDAVAPNAIPQEELVHLMADLVAAENPLIITTYLGKKAEAVEELIKLCDTLSIPVVECIRSNMNFPADHPLHLGYTADQFVEKSDFILVIDCDVPWIISKCSPPIDAKVYMLDVDPLKINIPLWYLKSNRFFQADSLSVLKQMNQYMELLQFNKEAMVIRRNKISDIHNKQRLAWKASCTLAGNTITPSFVSACLNEVIDADTIILNETVTNEPNVNQNIPRTKPGTFFSRGGTSLGWNGGAAIGIKLANPDKLVVSLTGDGTYLFSVPSSVYWMASRYNTPFLTVIYNNFGWNATKKNVLHIHPDGYAQRNDTYWVNFQKPADLAKVAEAAGGAYAETVKEPEHLKDALLRGLQEVKNGRCAVINVFLEPISNQM
jgi:acetolactate synthase-1/2/3 large subunit